MSACVPFQKDETHSVEHSFMKWSGNVQFIRTWQSNMESWILQQVRPTGDLSLGGSGTFEASRQGSAQGRCSGWARCEPVSL